MAKTDKQITSGDVAPFEVPAGQNWDDARRGDEPRIFNAPGGTETRIHPAEGVDAVRAQSHVDPRTRDGHTIDEHGQISRAHEDEPVAREDLSSARTPVGRLPDGRVQKADGTIVDEDEVDNPMPPNGPQEDRGRGADEASEGA